MPKEITILIIVISALFFLAIIGFFSFCIYISAYMADRMCMPRHYKTREEKDKELDECGHRDGFDEYKRVPIEFKMSDGYIIHGDYSLNDPNKFVICMHGHTSLRDASMKYSYAFYRLG